MERPKCKLCGTRHWANEPHTIVTASSSIVKVSIAGAEPKAIVPAENRVKFDRNAYQREYMRKRRAKTKANP